MKERIKSVMKMMAENQTPGTGISGGTGTICEVVAEKIGSLFRTTILIDLTGLTSAATGDIIGVDATSNPCYLMQLSSIINGTIFAGSITCHEVPAGGGDDLDLYAADEGTGVENGAIADLTETSLIDSGAWTLGEFAPLTAFPTDGQYLYLVCQEAVAAAYTAGILKIELWGK